MLFYIDYEFDYIDDYGDKITESGECYKQGSSVDDVLKKFKAWEKNAKNIRVFKLVKEERDKNV